MKLESQVCSLELSKRLKELGVKQESLFYWMLSNISGEWVVTDTVFYEKTTMMLLKEQPERIVSAFTVAELGEMLPFYIRYERNKKEGWSVFNEEIWTIAATEADARAKMLIHLIEKGIVKP